MLAIASVFASLFLAATANPVARAACNPDLAGQLISIGSGSFEIGYGSSVVGAPIVTHALAPLTAEWVAEIPSNHLGFLLADFNGPNPQLYTTNANGVSVGNLTLQNLISPPDSGVQTWGFVCTTCNAPGSVSHGGVIASSCNVVTGSSGKCLQIGSTVGAAATVQTCTDLPTGPQKFSVYLA
ncbi:hypothetical protein FB45DRAFT_1032548 [Roridomyces roridus]|uniref:Uncharacterized protein n=1 Tax=Roridomyces roridus TaxID=1738132 RepID=A0AAD7BHK9_9AGAR|nr:hypothetical protein FB45DRAFT_1032548 [Roridomyces roridus]